MIEAMLGPDGVGQLIGVTGRTVTQYLCDSTHGRRYSSRPFPQPDGYYNRSPWWSSHRTPEIIAWSEGRVGRGRRAKEAA